jgi:hypothetical protein
MNMYKKIFDFGTEISFHSNHSPQEALERIKRGIKNNSLSVKLLGAVMRPRLVGELNKDKVVIYKARPGARLLFNPYFYGHFIKEDNESVLKGKFSVLKPAKVMVSILLTILFVLEVLFLSTFMTPDINDYSMSQRWLLALICPIVATVMLGFILLIKQSTRRDVNEISEEIKQQLS